MPSCQVCRAKLVRVTSVVARQVHRVLQCEDEDDGNGDLEGVGARARAFVWWGRRRQWRNDLRTRWRALERQPNGTRMRATMR